MLAASVMRNMRVISFVDVSPNTLSPAVEKTRHLIGIVNYTVEITQAGDNAVKTARMSVMETKNLELELG